MLYKCIYILCNNFDYYIVSRSPYIFYFAFAPWSQDVKVVQYKVEIAFQFSTYCKWCNFFSDIMLRERFFVQLKWKKCNAVIVEKKISITTYFNSENKQDASMRIQCTIEQEK
ncbi:hypothetical protein HN51_071281 [Arachis hypogaea]